MRNVLFFALLLAIIVAVSGGTYINRATYQTDNLFQTALEHRMSH